VLHRDSIYCVGFHLGHQEIRTLLLDRMRDTECAINERFELPGDFRIDEYFQGEFGIFRDTERQQKVVIEFDAQAADYIRARRVHGSQRLATVAGGGVRLTMTIGNLTQVVSWVLEWGARAKVLEPPELVEKVRKELTGALALYPASAKSDPKKRRG
jgi:predicted DNA-binding transcriptional regulator YafY